MNSQCCLAQHLMTNPWRHLHHQTVLCLHTHPLSFIEAEKFNICSLPINPLFQSEKISTQRQKEASQPLKRIVRTEDLLCSDSQQHQLLVILKISQDIKNVKNTEQKNTKHLCLTVAAAQALVEVRYRSHSFSTVTREMMSLNILIIIKIIVRLQNCRILRLVIVYCVVRIKTESCNCHVSLLLVFYRELSLMLPLVQSGVK